MHVGYVKCIVNSWQEEGGRVVFRDEVEVELEAERKKL